MLSFLRNIFLAAQFGQSDSPFGQFLKIVNELCYDITKINKNKGRCYIYLANFIYGIVGMEETMVFIYICENDLELRGKIEKEINNYINEKKYQMRIQLSTSDSIQLLEKVQNSTKRGLYFIDTDFDGELKDGLSGDMKEDHFMKEESFIEEGILLGKEIRKRDARGFIAFITSNKVLILQAFKHHIEVVDYIMKDESGEMGISESIRKCLDTVAQRAEDEFLSKMSLVYHSDNK